MAKRRKGAKKSSASGSRTKRPTEKKRPVSPAPKKAAPKKGGSTQRSRSRAAVKGWETRRRENPLRWGVKAIAKRRKQLKTLEFTTKDIEKGWQELERKALRQDEEARRTGGEHPIISAKLAPLERLEAQIAEMKTMIRTFNSPSPDHWELTAYHMLENFITIKDMGGLEEDTWVIAVGTEVLSKYGDFKDAERAQDFIDSHAIERGRPLLVTGVKTAYQKWYEAKQEARAYSPDWPAWMAMIGSVLGLPMHGHFSVESFVTS